MHWAHKTLDIKNLAAKCNNTKVINPYNSDINNLPMYKLENKLESENNQKIGILYADNDQKLSISLNHVENYKITYFIYLFKNRQWINIYGL